MILYRNIWNVEMLIHSFCFQKGELKLGDFGLARAFGIPVRNYSHEVDTVATIDDILSALNNEQIHNRRSLLCGTERQMY